MGEQLSKLFSLLKREYWGISGNTLLIITILVFPIAFGFMFGTFKNVVSKNAPSAVFPLNGAADEDLRFAQSAASLFSKSSIEQDFEESKLFREEYYFYVGIPKGFKQNSGSMDVYIDSSMSPVSELSPYVRQMVLYGFSKWAGVEPKISIIEVGRKVLPFQYFIPGILVILSALIGLVIVPFSLSADKDVLKRVLLGVSEITFISSKFIFASFLSLVQLAVLSITQVASGVPASALFIISPLSIGTLILATLFFTSIGISVMLLTGFRETGKQLNAGLLGFSIVFSGAFYPVGFFPSLPGFGDLLQVIGRSNPPYIFVLLMRGFGLRGLGLQFFLDYAAIALFTALAAGVLLVCCIRRFKHA
jgi:hypothetical protein